MVLVLNMMQVLLFGCMVGYREDNGLLFQLTCQNCICNMLWNHADADGI